MRLNPTVTGALLAALGVGLGAFGAHGLRGVLDAGDLATFETGVRYQMYVALALLALGAGGRRGAWVPLLLAGAVIFSGSLYLLVLTGPRWLGAVTPIGGVLMIAGLLVAAWEARSREGGRA
ncbi:DUF423 domain-containing protein [Deinococcus sp. NW-56]|uniref:DUF423 domain-containing protein n=1 Tax=Deinococcus sp. NW-56 TaxID=2080419 RepID=UPI000CF3C9E4|nr:DUF423 domain-containing protein [Deinococcus sp. NW-56]